MEECWYSTDNGDYLFESSASAKAFGLFNDLLNVYRFNAEMQYRNNKFTVVAVDNSTYPDIVHQISLIKDMSNTFISEELVAGNIYDCAIKLYNHFNEGKFIKVSNTLLGPKSPGVGKFMMDFVLLGL